MMENRKLLKRKETSFEASKGCRGAKILPDRRIVCAEKFASGRPKTFWRVLRKKPVGLNDFTSAKDIVVAPSRRERHIPATTAVRHRYHLMRSRPYKDG
jgi:hypothetical protein